MDSQKSKVSSSRQQRLIRLGRCFQADLILHTGHFSQGAFSHVNAHMWEVLCETFKFKQCVEASSSTKPFLCTVLFVLRFYGPVNPMRSCRARSVYLTARLLGRLSLLSG